MSGNSSGLWKAQPHTIAKIKLLESYLYKWFAIIGRTYRKQSIVYIDGFCGPGRYKNYDKGSPLAAVNAANKAIKELGPSWVAGKVDLFFIDENTEAIRNLEMLLAEKEMHGNVEYRCINGAFNTAINGLMKILPGHFAGKSPLFVFIDPFGATGTPFATISQILKSDCSEILINFDADGVARIFSAGEHAKHDHHLTEIFGDRSWKAKFNGPYNFGEVCTSALDLYKTKLSGVPGVKYVFPFEMQNEKGLEYYLIFASHHKRGLQKMKESMKQFDQDGSYTFSDARAKGQQTLFRFDNPEPFAEKMYQAYQGSTRSYSKLEEYALCATPFINPKSMLKILENSGRIKVNPAKGEKRKTGTYPEDKIESITFVDDTSDARGKAP